ncbi:hypothetical protein OIU76_002439 [Salix suchowensis]|nr:hypothetical protein OIU76_002439 [Salix suchowensis]
MDHSSHSTKILGPPILRVDFMNMAILNPPEHGSVDASFVGDGNGKLWNVPDSRADMFKNKSLTLMEKNQLMRFFKLVMGREGENFGRGFGEAVYRLPVENVVYKCFQGIDVSCLWSRGSATSPAVKGCIYVGSTEGNCRDVK